MRNRSLTSITLAVALSASLAFAQKPVIAPNSVLNAASLVLPPTTGHALAPGSIASIFGQNLAATTASFTGYPLTTSLAGTSVTLGGAAAPLFYVSPGQINFQVPHSQGFSSVPGSPYLSAAVIVTTAGVSSDPVSVDITGSGPGIFTQDGSGCGPGVILNVKPDGTVSLNPTSNSASPGDYLEMFGTGFNNPPYYAPYAVPDGYPAPADVAQFAQTAGGVFDNTQRPIQFSSLGGLQSKAPGLVGVDQINTLVPIGVREGCAVPLHAGGSVVSGPPLVSQDVLVSIHTGGGQCVDPPLAGFGQITLTKTITLSSSPATETDTFAASFDASPGKQVAAPVPPSFIGSPGQRSYLKTYFLLATPPPCPLPGYVTLDAETISAKPPAAAPISIPPSLAGGRIVYQANLPSGSVRAGPFQISTGGCQDVGRFQVNVPLGADLKITSQFPAGTSVNLGRPLSVNWTGGDSNSVVTVKLVAHFSNSLEDLALVAVVPASDGIATFPIVPMCNGCPFGLDFPAASNVEIDIDVEPDPAQAPTFAALGLTLGGRINWKYEYRFTGLLTQ